tara:strand:+ start:255 stop:674 length:420 start_codon:yes stop_codon:yes gene_type:complete
MDYENEINKILESIDNTIIQPLNIICDRRNKIINTFYSKFLNYNVNNNNLKESLKILENYEYITSIINFKKGDKFRFLSKKCFYDLKVSPLVSLIQYKNGIITYRNGLFINSVRDDVCLFKYIQDELLVKMKLMELIED